MKKLAKNEDQVRIYNFDSMIGSCAVAFQNERIVGLQLPHQNARATEQALAQRFPLAIKTSSPTKWERSVIKKLKCHLAKGRESLQEIATSVETTPFFSKIYQIVKQIPPGKTLTYGEVARRAGRAKAARAVGQAMAKNPVPLIIPCHRVLGSTGKLTGFNAFDGVKLKSRLLELEGAQI
jgi:methylated-DNA-[protein]-cysteine S-methyltransferase